VPSDDELDRFAEYLARLVRDEAGRTSRDRVFELSDEACGCGCFSEFLTVNEHVRLR
jgi:hypothetical protein